jgi:hypothetical protein
LFIGNSYTFADDLEQRYAEVRAADAEAREVIVERIASPGYRLEQHLADLQTPGSATATRWASHCGGEAPWTYVVLQEQSQIPGFPADEPAAVASRAAAVALGERARACGAEPVLFETWGRRDGDADNPGLFPDYPTMQDRLDEGFEAMAAAGGLRRARVGAAFRALHARPDFDFGRLYVADGSHPSALGTWLAALVIAGVTPSRDATRPTLGGRRRRGHCRTLRAGRRGDSNLVAGRSPEHHRCGTQWRADAAERTLSPDCTTRPSISR